MYVEHYEDGSKGLIIKPEEVELLIEILTLIPPKDEAAERAIQKNIDDLVNSDDLSPHRTIN